MSISLSMPNYNLGKIYKITSPNTNQIYIGSTAQKYLTTRFTKHKYAYFALGRTDYTSHIILAKGDAKIEMIEQYPCNKVEELYARERYWIEQLKDIAVNKSVPIRTDEEKTEYKRKKGAVYRKKYPQKIKDINKKNNAKRNKISEEIVNCECGAKSSKRNIARHRKSKKHLKLLS